MNLISAIFGFFASLVHPVNIPVMDHFDSSLTAQMAVDESVEFIRTAHAKKQEVSFDFNEAEFTKAYPDWRKV
jgi:hypothetical protein